jgi:predicted NAD/FAD-dependent oxidoreductase
MLFISLDREKADDVSELMFDHGAQYFTVKTAEVQQLVDKWQASGLVADWEGRFGSLNVATGDFVEETVRT